MEVLKPGEKLPTGKFAVTLAGLGAPRITVVSESIEELQHYAVTYSAFWELGSRAWRGGKLNGMPGANEMDFNGEIWQTVKGKRRHVKGSTARHGTPLYQKCLEEIMDQTC